MTTAKSGASGDYAVPFLAPGNYIISAEATGFKTAQRSNVQLHVGDKLIVDLNLPAGAVSEVITVSDTPPLLDEGSATRGGLIDNAKVEELPIIGRNPINLANLVPGRCFQWQPVIPAASRQRRCEQLFGQRRYATDKCVSDRWRPDDTYSDTAGDRSHANLNVAYIPSAEVTQEFKVVSNFYDAQYGRPGGGIFNVGTKVGTNRFHGAAYYFFSSLLD